MTTNHVTTALSDDVYRAVEALRGTKGRSTFIRELISNNPEVKQYLKTQPKID